jgi:anaerobic magnesium-protoporphyrin IX monomethyl ester cyclase
MPVESITRAGKFATDVLLTHSYHLANDPKQVRKMQPYPPLGTLYAASALRAADKSVAVFDSLLEDPLLGFPQALKQHCPAIVVIYEDDFNFLSKMCLTSMRALAWQLASMAKMAGAVVVAHGSDASDHAEAYLRNGVDFVLLGEAEQSLVDLCTSLLSATAPRNIPGLLQLDVTGNLLESTLKAPKNLNWNKFFAPARELIDLQPYRKAWVEAHGQFSTNVVASRGCPYKCNWCAKPISGNRYQLRPPELVAAEICELKTAYGVEHIWFGDDVFALNHRWVEQFANEIESRDCVLPFKIQSRADLMNISTVANLKRAGCAEIWMGVESGSQKVLDAMDKGLQVSEVIQATQLLRDAGIRACFFLQFGYPGELWDDIRQTIDLVLSLRPDDIGVSFSYPLPGTLFYERVQEQIGLKRNWTDSDDLCLMFRATYRDEFYLALRNALHAEVASWQGTDASQSGQDRTQLWQRVFELESVTRNIDPISIAQDIPSPSLGGQPFVPLQALTSTAKEM